MNVIEFKSWDYTCSDGCCYDAGTSLSINGEEVCDNVDLLQPDQLVELVLEKLGVSNFEILKG